MDIQLAQIFFQMINFLVVFGALAYLLYKPILKIFDERAKRIEEGQKAAQKAIESQEHLEQMRKDVQLELKKERSAVLTKAQAEAKKQAQEVLAKAKSEAETEVERLKEAWEKEKRQMVKDLRGEMTDAVIAVSQTVVQKLLDAKSQKKLIDQELDTILKKL